MISNSIWFAVFFVLFSTIAAIFVCVRVHVRLLRVLNKERVCVYVVLG